MQDSIEIICVSNDYNKHSYTIGRVYEYKNGGVIDNYERKRPINCSTGSIEQWLNLTHAKFVMV